MAENVVIIGPGRMGLALGTALRQVGAVDSLTFHGRALEPPPHPIFDMGDPPAKYGIGVGPLPPGTSVVFLAVPDSALGDVAYDLSRSGPAPVGCSALHLAGALSTDVLAPLHAVGYSIGSFHPLQTVADPWSAGDRLIGAAFALAGEPSAIAAGRRLVSELDGLALVIAGPLRPVYHAAAVFGSNYLIAMISVAVRLLEQAGVDSADALPAILPLVRGTLDNLEHLGIASALTGPIPRGDVDTIRLHLMRLSGAERELYCSLGRELLGIARIAGLDESRAAEIETLLANE
jgi:predicted short-subunit dehydrogenase-like oxidoreductase (DUF2520 family)